MWRIPEDGPFQIESGLFSSRWMREARPGEVREALGEEPQPVAAGGGGDMGTMSDDELRAHYEAIMGEKAHHAAKRDTLIDRITAKLNAD